MGPELLGLVFLPSDTQFSPPRVRGAILFLPESGSPWPLPPALLPRWLWMRLSTVEVAQLMVRVWAPELVDSPGSNPGSAVSTT